MEQYNKDDRMKALSDFRKKIISCESDPSTYNEKCDNPKTNTTTCGICFTDNIDVYDLYDSDDKPHGHGLYCLHCIHNTFSDSKLGSEDIPVDDKCPFYPCNIKVSSSNLSKIINDKLIVENYAIKIGEIKPIIVEVPWNKTWNENFMDFIKSMDSNFGKTDSVDLKTCFTMCPRCLEIGYVDNTEFNCGYNVNHKCINKSKFMEEHFPSESEKMNRYCIICSRPSCKTHYINDKPGDLKDSMVIRNQTDVNASCGGKEEFLARLFAVRYVSFFLNLSNNVSVDDCAKYSQLNFKQFIPRAKRFIQKYPRFETLCGMSHLSCNLKQETKKYPTKLKMSHIKMTKPKPMSKRPWKGGSNKKTRKQQP
jgi:hypothetical protein